MNDRPIFNFPTHAKFVRGYVNSLKGLYWVDITRCRDQRSLSQNAYLHGVVFPDIAPGLAEAYGHRVDAKEFLKDKFLRVAVCDLNTGEVVGHVTRGTHELNTEECSRFIDECITFAADFLNTKVRPAAQFETEAAA